MRSTHLAIAAGIALTCIAVTTFYLGGDRPSGGESVESLQKKLAESERTIAELRARALGSSTQLVSRDEFASSSKSSETGTNASREERLEEIATRMEARVAELEKHLKRANIIPMTREERTAEITREEESLAKMEKELREQQAKVTSLARIWNVPAEVETLDPWEKENGAIHQRYRTYFEVQKRAGYLQKYVTEQRNKIMTMELLCSL